MLKQQLANITAQLENKAASEQELLDRLISLAVSIERATVKHMYRFYSYARLRQASNSTHH